MLKCQSQPMNLPQSVRSRKQMEHRNGKEKII